MYKVAICEDDNIQRTQLKEYIIKIFQESNLSVNILEFESGENFLETNPKDIDIYFLDIKMNEITGMDIAKKIRAEDNLSEIIFTTCLVEYIQEGYVVRAYRYLLKPIKYEELKEHLMNCIKDISKKREKFIMIKVKNSTIQKIEIDDILYIDILKREITIHTTKGIYKTINKLCLLEKELKDYNFFRCHKSFLVNIDHIESLNKNSVYVNSEEVPVSKHRMRELKSKLAQILGDIIC